MVEHLAFNQVVAGSNPVGPTVDRLIGNRMIMDIGRVCVKVRGKDAGNYCVVVERINKNFVLVEGKNMKRRRVNIMHLEPLPKILNIKKDSNRESILNELKKAGF